MRGRTDDEFVRRISAYTGRGTHSDAALLAVISILVGCPIVLVDATNYQFPDSWTIQQFIDPGLHDQPWTIGEPLSDRHLLIVYCHDHFEPAVPNGFGDGTYPQLRLLVEDVWRRVHACFMMEPPATPGWQLTRYKGADGAWVDEIVQTQATRAVLRANCELPLPVIRALLANTYQLSWNGSNSPDDTVSHNPDTPNRACEDMYFVRPVDLTRHVSGQFLGDNLGQYYASSKFDSLNVIVPCMYPSADGSTAEVITVAMRATRFVVFHATPQLPRDALDALSVLKRAWFETVMKEFRKAEYRTASRKRQGIIEAFREPNPNMDVVSVPEILPHACLSVRGMALFYWAVETVRAAGVVEMPADRTRLVRCAAFARLRACLLACSLAFTLLPTFVLTFSRS